MLAEDRHGLEECPCDDGVMRHRVLISRGDEMLTHHVPEAARHDAVKGILNTKLLSLCGLRR